MTQVHRAFVCVLISCVTASARAGEDPPTLTGKDGGTMVLVPGGAFVMGSGEGRDDETPPRTINVAPFYIDKLEVTNAQYLRFVTETGTKPPLNWGGPKPAEKAMQLPVTDVSWFDAMRYAAWAGKRLPTETEWEKAARGKDGRRFPWGNEDNPAARNINDASGIQPVGSRLAGASPYGCLDMSGNAWEWVADWYDAYPGTSARSVHFGTQYKVMRGGGGIYFYGYPNTGRCAQRSRLVPFGSHDGLGFRCAMSTNDEPAPYDAAKVLAEAEDLLKATLQPPVELSHEKTFNAMAGAKRFPLQVVGATGQQGIARTGIPLPQDALKRPDDIRVLSEGRPLAAQAKTLATYANGSPRWVLIDFPARAGGAYEVDYSGQGDAAPRTPALQVRDADGVMRVETGAVTLIITATDFLKEVQSATGRPLLSAMQVDMEVVDGAARAKVALQPADKVEIESAGPLHAAVRLSGKTARSDGRESPFRYDLRIHATAGSARIHMPLTLTHIAPRRPAKTEYEKPFPVVDVADLRVTFKPAEPAASVVFGGDRGVHEFAADKGVELIQPDDLKCTITVEGGQPSTGTRAPGWMRARTPGGDVLVGLRHFWQNHIKTLRATADDLTVGLWTGAAPFEWESGLAKTHELVLDFSPAAAPGQPVTLEPLRVTMSPAWACGSGALGTILPRGPEAIERFPYWELLRDAAKRNWVRSMPFGMRDFGDAYMGGPYKGKNAYTNLEYDVPLNFLMDFLKSGEVWLAEAAEVQARHQTDVDVDHFNGRVWKHSPQHTTTEAEFGHVFLRGVLMQYLLSGDQRLLDVAREVGDWMAPRVARTEGMGNERQIGWSLYALSGLYEVTRDQKYLDACLSACRKLASGQAATGKFNIRWDNRISFFNGIAMMGMLCVQEMTGDPEIAKTILAVANRTLGFYPEYALRTTNAFCWAAVQTNDPRYLVELDRTWRSSMEFLMGRDAGVTEEVYAWRFTWFACKRGLMPMFEKPPEALPDAATWRGLRLDQQRVEMYLMPSGSKPSNVMVIVEGQSPGIAELFDPSGKLVKTLRFDDPSRQFQAAVFTLPPGSAPHLLRLRAETANAWQVHYDANTRITVYDPGLFLLPVIYPRATGYVKEGAKEIKVRLEAMNEGFHAATLYNPAGQVVATVRKFVDFQDPNRYEIELKAPISGGDAKGWGLEVYNAKVLSIEGMQPYWSGDAEQLFSPERPGE